MRKGFGNRTHGRRAEFEFLHQPAAAAAPSEGIKIPKVVGIVGVIGLFVAIYSIAVQLTGPKGSQSASAGGERLRVTMAEKDTAAGYRKLVEIQAQAAAKLRQQLPKRVDRTMTLFDARSNGTKFIYNYQIKAKKSRINMAKFYEIGRKNLTRHACRNRAMRKVLRFGGIYEYAYYDRSKSYIGSFSISEGNCA